MSRQQETMNPTQDLDTPLLDDSFLSDENDNTGAMHDQEITVEHSDNLLQHQSRDTASNCWEPNAYYMLPTAILLVVCSSIWAPILPQTKVDWYSDCLNQTVACSKDTDAAQFYSGIYDSIRGFVCFSVAGTLGRLSDSVGRKPILLYCISMSMLPTLALYFTDGKSAVAFFSASIVSGFAGVGSAGSTAGTVMVAYVADLYSSDERIVYFGYIFAAAGLSMCFSPFFSTLSKNYLKQNDLFLISIFISIMNLLYVAFIVPESLVKEKRNPFSKRTVDPFAPLRLLRRSGVLKWLSLVVLLNSLPETGLVETLFIFCDKTLGLNVDGKADEEKAFNAILLAIAGASGIFAQTVLIGVMKRLNINETTVLAVASVANATHLFLFALLVRFPYKEVAYFAEIWSALVMLSSSASNAIVSKYMGPYEQGFAFGTLGAVKGLTAAISPMAFSVMLALFDKQWHMPELSFIVGAIIALSAFYFTLVPLKREIRRARLVRFSHSMMFSPANKVRYAQLLTTDDGSNEIPAPKVNVNTFCRERLGSISETDEEIENDGEIDVI